MNFVGISRIFVHLETEKARISWDFLGFLRIAKMKIDEFCGNL